MIMKYKTTMNKRSQPMKHGFAHRSFAVLVSSLALIATTPAREMSSSNSPSKQHLLNKEAIPSKTLSSHYNPSPDFFSGSELEIFEANADDSTNSEQVLVRFVGNASWELSQFLTAQKNIKCQAADEGAECIFALSTNGFLSRSLAQSDVGAYFRFKDAGVRRDLASETRWQSLKKVNLQSNETKVAVAANDSIRELLIRGPDSQFLARWIHASSTSRKQILPIGIVSRGNVTCDTGRSECRIKVAADGAVASVPASDGSNIASDLSDIKDRGVN
jgi:hypothetical protein